MRIFLTLLVLCFSVAAVAQKPVLPRGNPSPKGFYAQYDWVRGDSGLLMTLRRDTAWNPVRPGISAISFAGDTAKLFFFDGKKWGEVSKSNKVDSVTLLGDSLLYWINGTDFFVGNIASAASGGDTTIFDPYIDSTGLPSYFIPIAFPNGFFSYDSTIRYQPSTKAILIGANSALVQLQVKGRLAVSGGAQIGGTITALGQLNTTDTVFFKPVAQSIITKEYRTLDRWPITDTDVLKMVGVGLLKSGQTVLADTGRHTTQLVTGGGLKKVADSLGALIGGGGGVTTMAAIGSSPNANGATISGSALTLQPASAAFGGVVTTGVQTFEGVKTFNQALQTPEPNTNTAIPSLYLRNAFAAGLRMGIGRNGGQGSMQFFTYGGYRFYGGGDFNDAATDWLTIGPTLVNTGPSVGLRLGGILQTQLSFGAPHNIASPSIYISDGAAPGSRTGIGKGFLGSFHSFVRSEFGQNFRWYGGGDFNESATNWLYLDQNGLAVTGTNAASAALTINSTTRGFLPPRMTSTQRNAIASPATGLVVYNTTDNRLDFYNGTAWGAVASTTNSLTLGYTAITATYNVADTDYTIHVTANSPTINLPTAVGRTGRVYIIKNSGTGFPVVDGSGAETIDGNITITLGVETLRIQSTGTNWIII